MEKDKKIIFINGSINAGKSTIAKLLAKKIPNTAIIEIDALRAMIDWMLLPEAISINLENAVSLIKNFLDKGLNVVVPYPLSQKNYEYLTSELKNVDARIYFFTLSPKLENILTNRGGRELTESEKERIKYHYDTEINTPSFGFVVDNTKQTPEETLEEMFKNLK